MTQIKKWVLYAVLLAMGAVVTAPLATQALVNYPPAALLQPGDIINSMIRDNNITDVKIASTSAIQSAKIKVLGGDGFIHFTASNAIATGTNLYYDATGNKLYVATGELFASTTYFGGAAYTWPSADGGSGQALQTNGSGTLSWASAAATFLTTAVTGGEAIAAGMPVVIATSSNSTTSKVTFASGGTVNALIGETSQVKHAESYTEARALCIKTVTADVDYSGTPTTNLVFSIQADNAGSPSGTMLASSTVAHTSITTAQATYTFTLDTKVCSAPSVKYWLVVGTDGATDATNYYQWFILSGNAYANGDEAVYNGTSWSTQTYDANGSVQSNYVAGYAYAATASENEIIGHFVGIADGAIASSTAGTIYTAGTATGLSGLTPGQGYYLGDALGSVSLTPGASTHKLCVAITSTTCAINTSW